MSRIFDALQRSESERDGTDSATLPQGPELLRRTERRVASNWEAAVSTADPEVTKIKKENDLLGQGAAFAQAVLEAPPVEEISSDRERSNILDLFQPLPVLHPLSASSRLVCLTDKESPTAEALRLLGVRLRDIRRIRPLKKVLITSTIPQEGKSTISGNLACALANSSDEKILLVEGDVRRPSLLKMFGVEKAKGICELLQEKSDMVASIHHLEAAGLWILPAGSAPGNPLEILQSPGLPALMHQLASCFDWIIIDSAPVLPLADTSIWMRLADGILLVTREGTTEKKQLEKGLEAIDRQKLLGALLNGTVASVYSGYYYSAPTGS